MPDCEAGPAVLARARRYTRYPKQFESQLRAVLPRLAYVQQAAARYGIAGEFVLLPWVESHFRPLTSRHNRPAGMWQIMPITAGAMGLRVDGHYDGRLNVPAATDAVMKLLKQYHAQFHDWRVADYAYNAGEFTIRRIIQRHGLPGAKPVIPRWPVRKATRKHLIKLLAIACVVREPARFHVSLPALPGGQHLVTVKVTHPISMTMAARHAGMPTKKLKRLNSAFRGSMVDTRASPYLLVPKRHARQLREALLERNRDGTPAMAPTPTTHRVKRGDSLWKIARQYAVQVSQLKRWNHLQGDTLKIGQALLVGAPQ
ncbi:MAG: LysM peptidoglycan-binding domain-containing protein [Rhodanobacter sp.]|nr:MAG: LysM peptidoglycan-binding domain-containing protein [Rhodanobacter sp.]